MEVSKRLFELRKARDLSQNQLARLSGVAQGAISQYEAGKAPSPDVLEKLCAGLGITLAEFFSPASPDAAYGEAEPDLQVIAWAYRKMTDADRKKMMRILRASFEEYFGARR